MSRGKRSLLAWIASQASARSLAIRETARGVELSDLATGRRIAVASSERLVVVHRELGEIQIESTDDAY